mgnify:CR=1 FL=1
MGGEFSISNQVLATQKPHAAIEDFGHLPAGDKFSDRKEDESKGEMRFRNSLAEIWRIAKREFAFSHSGAGGGIYRGRKRAGVCNHAAPGG